MSEGTVFQRSDGRWCAKWKDARGDWKYLYRKSNRVDSLNHSQRDRQSCLKLTIAAF
jgi:hypothetical protein